MRNLITPINLYERGNLISLITYEPNLKEIIQTEAVRKCIVLRKHMKPTSPKIIFEINSIQQTLHSFWFRTLFLLTCRFLWILQGILYLIPHSSKQQLHPLLTETAKCFSLPQLFNDIIRYSIRHAVLRYPDWLQHVQNSYMGGNPSESGCLVCFVPGKVCCWNIDQRRIKMVKNSWRIKCLSNIILVEVGFICFLNPIHFLTDFLNNFLQVWSIGNQRYQVTLFI